MNIVNSFEDFKAFHNVRPKYYYYGKCVPEIGFSEVNHLSKVCLPIDASTEVTLETHDLKLSLLPESIEVILRTLAFTVSYDSGMRLQYEMFTIV